MSFEQNHDVYIRPKKISTPALVSIIVAAAALLIVGIILLISTFVQPRTALAAEEFILHMQELGFTVEDRTYRHSERESLHAQLGYVKTDLAVTSEYFHIEFFVFSTEARARQAYGASMRELEDARRGGAASHSQVCVLNFNRFTQTFGGLYHVVCRVDNTLVWAATTAENRAALNEILEILGY